MRNIIIFGMLLCASAVQWDPWKKLVEKFTGSGQSAKPNIIQSVRKLTSASGLPTEPGCYRRFPTGCFRFPATANAAAWKHEKIVEHKNTAATARETCMMRAKRLNTYCGVRDTEMMFIPGEVKLRSTPTTTPSQLEEVEEVDETTTPVPVRIEVPVTTIASTTPEPIQEIMDRIGDRKSMSDFVQQVDKEAEEEFNKAKKAADVAEAIKAAERERRNAIRKAAEEARGVADSKKDAMVKARSMLQDKAAEVKKAADDVEKRHAEVETAREASVEAAAAVESASRWLEKKKKGIKHTEERLDAVEADGRDPDAALKQELANKKEALANLEAVAEVRRSGLQQAERRALEVEAALREAEAKLAVNEAERKSLDERARLAAAEYEAARDHAADAQRLLAKSTRDLESAEAGAKADKAAAQERLREAHEARQRAAGEAPSGDSAEDSAEDLQIERELMGSSSGSSLDTKASVGGQRKRSADV